MKKKIYLFLALVCCIAMMTGCSFSSRPSTSSGDSSTEESQEDKANTDDNFVPDDAEDVPVTDPVDSSKENDTPDQSDSSSSKAENPQENVANDSSKEYTTTGKYCGFTDSHSVEIELADGSFWTFFTFDETVTNILSSLDEEDTPEITFTYKARDEQINPEIIEIKTN